MGCTQASIKNGSGKQKLCHSENGVELELVTLKTGSSWVSVIVSEPSSSGPEGAT